MSKFHLDLSKFKKISSDKEKTVLQNDEGHQLTLNHGSLDQKRLGALNGLPLLSQENKLPPKRFAEGGGSGDQAPLEVEPISDEEASDGSEPQDPSQQASPAPEAPTAPESAQAPKAAAPAAQAAQPQSNAEPAFTTDKANNAAIVAQEDADIAHDLNQGHISPKTYSDLLGDKSALGKVGSIFGLLVGGMGAGLTHSENPVIAMWNNQISQDLEAQKQNQSNKQTLLGLNRQRFADIDSAMNLTRMQENRIYIHHLAEKVNQLPAGNPERVKAEQALATAGQFVDLQNMQLSDQIAAKQALMKSMESGVSGPEAGYQNRQKAMRLSGNPALAKMADYNDERHLPGVEGSASVPIPQANKDELQAMNVLDNKAADILNFAKANKGTLSPSKQAIGAQKAEEMVNFYNNSIKGGVLTEGRLKWLDDQIKKNPTSIFQDVLGNNARLQEIQNSNNQRRGILLKSLGFPVSQPSMQSPQAAPSPQPQSDAGEIRRRDPRSGKVAVFDQNKKFIRWQ